jgi:hypothetical protein
MQTPEIISHVGHTTLKDLTPLSTAAMHKLVHLIYGVLKTRQPFKAEWARPPLLAAVLPLSPHNNLTLALDFQDGI